MICKPKHNQEYNAWLHWNISSQCNSNCEYCFGKTPVNLKEIQSIQIDKLINTLSKTGKTFRISFTGGEPFLIPNILETAITLIKHGHFISFNTNLVMPAVVEFSNQIDPGKVLFIQASFHPKELVDKNLLKTYIKHFHLLKENGFNVIAEAVSYPPYEKELLEFEQLLKEENIKLEFAPYIGKFEDKNYPKHYHTEQIENLRFDPARIDYHYQKGEACNAGYTAGVVYSSGDVYPCFQVKNKLGNIYEGIKFYDELKNCPAKFCGCPLNKYDPELFNKSLK